MFACQLISSTMIWQRYLVLVRSSRILDSTLYPSFRINSIPSPSAIAFRIGQLSAESADKRCGSYLLHPTLHSILGTLTGRIEVSGAWRRSIRKHLVLDDYTTQQASGGVFNVL
jgi:hypothetical protein